MSGIGERVGAPRLRLRAWRFGALCLVGLGILYLGGQGVEMAEEGMRLWPQRSIGYERWGRSYEEALVWSRGAQALGAGVALVGLVGIVVSVRRARRAAELEEQWIADAVEESTRSGRPVGNAAPADKTTPANPRGVDVPRKRKGSITAAIVLMFVISLLLFWLPFVGPLIAGLVGGHRAGGIGPALAAVFLPGLIFGALLFVFASSLSGVPLLGMVAGIGGVALALTHSGPLLLGAILGGFFA